MCQHIGLRLITGKSALFVNGVDYLEACGDLKYFNISLFYLPSTAYISCMRIILFIYVCVCACACMRACVRAASIINNQQSVVLLFLLYVDVPINNQRFCSLKFTVHTSSMVHGFAGYFDTILYNQTTLSKYAPNILQLLL